MPISSKNCAQLNAQGLSVEFHTILFEAYLQGVPGATFHDYIRRLQDGSIVQTEDMNDAIHEIIMNMKKAKAKFGFLSIVAHGEPNLQTKKNIIALVAQVKELNDFKFSTKLVNKLKLGHRRQTNKRRSPQGSQFSFQQAQKPKRQVNQATSKEK